MTKMLFIFLATVASVVFPFAGEAQQDDREALLASHVRERQAHLRGDARLLTEGMAEVVREVRDGTVVVTTRDKMAEEFGKYFSRAKYSEWDDVAPPIVNVSKDRQVAWMLVQIKAKLKMLDSNNIERDLEFTSSWIATYEKQQGKWMMVAIASSVKQK